MRRFLHTRRVFQYPPGISLPAGSTRNPAGWSGTRLPWTLEPVSPSLLLSRKQMAIRRCGLICLLGHTICKSNSTLLKRNLWIFKSGVGIFIHFPVMKFQNTFLVNFQKRLLNFQIRLWKYVTFWKIHKESILKFHNREVNKNSNHQIWKFKDFVLTVNLRFH